MVKQVLALPFALVLAQPALADDAAPENAITVVATGSKLAVDQAGQPVTVLTADDLASIQGADITRALARVPGLTLSRNGGQGAFTGVRLRGSEAEQVLVLIDGVRVEDVSAPSGGFDFGTLTTGGIGRIDVLRGSNSVVWGSAAIGGVIAIESRELNGVDAVAEGGSGGSYLADATVGLSGKAYALTLNGGYAGSDGLASAAATGTERDGFRQWRIGGKGRLSLNDVLSITAVARYADTKTDIDGFPPPNYTFSDTAEFQKTRQISGRAGLRYETPGLTLDAGYALAKTDRDYYDPAFGTAPSYGYRAQSQRADLTGRVQLPARLALDFGADSEWTRYSGTFDAEQRARLASVHGLLGWYGDAATLAVGLRYDDHSRFGSAWTLGANGNVRLTDHLRLRASYGEAFKAPTLFQLLSNYGNLGVAPEHARSYDAGLEWSGSKVRAAVTMFRRDSRDLIAFVSCFGNSAGICTNRPFGTYDNIGKARAEGVEAELQLKPVNGLQLGFAYTYDKARNLTVGDANFGKDLARRPRHSLTTSIDWTTPLHGLILGADMHMQSESFDNAGNTTRIGGGTLTTVRASLPVSKRIELFTRVENLFDAHVQTIAGYGTPGRAAYGGLRVRY
ncbi:MAG: TonB-dependent receptor [Sphingomonadales bacterium]|nr:TonB-dependent receptor [Sphingomonadales bacterium]